MPALLRVLRSVLVTVSAGRNPSPASTSLPTGARTVAPASIARGATVLHGAGPIPARLAPAGSVGSRTTPRAIPTPRPVLAAGSRSVRASLELPAADVGTRPVPPAREPASPPAAPPLPTPRPQGEDPVR